MKKNSLIVLTLLLQNCCRSSIPSGTNSISIESCNSVIYVSELSPVQKKQNNYIVIYSSTCLACISLIDVIECNKTKLKENLYLVPYTLINYKDAKSNIGCEDIFLLSIHKVPCLIYFYDGKVQIEIYGFVNIQEYINNNLI